MSSLAENRSWSSPEKDPTSRVWRSSSIGDPMTGHQGVVHSVAFSPDGGQIVSLGSDNTLRRWDVDTGQGIGTPSWSP